MNLDTLLAEVNLQALALSIRLSIEEIEEKNGHRNDLLEPMRKHEANLKKAMFIWSELKRDIKLKETRINQLELENLELRMRNKFLEV